LKNQKIVILSERSESKDLRRVLLLRAKNTGRPL